VAGLAEGPAPCPGCAVMLTAAMFAVAGPEGPATDGTSDTEAPSTGGTPDDRAPATEGAPGSDPSDTGGPPEPDPSDPGGPPEPVPMSVRPPDLAPETVREAEVDVLAGWDVGADADEVASWQTDERPFPTDTVVVAGAGVLGALLGAAVGRERRGRGAVGGALLGVLAAALARRVWRLSP
jgi:hypothetical protein